MRVCYFGSYDRNYSRNRILIKGLRQNCVKVIECQDKSFFFLRCFKLFWKYLKSENHDVIIVGAQGHANVPLSKLLSTIFKKKIIFDPFISLYDTAVFDRKLVNEDSLKAKYYYYYLDKVSCMLSDIVITDTKEHLKYFHREFGIPKNKMRVIYVGSDDSLFFPRKTTRTDDLFHVYFYGTFIPLHGIQYIVKAAKMLEKENIIFKIIGKGQTFNQILKLSKELNVRNVHFLGYVKYEELPRHLAMADVCLGIFGDSDKAKRVIPNKVYDALAMCKPVITGDSPAIREILKDRRNVLLCEMANPEALADAILELRDNTKLREKIANNGHKVFKSNFTPKILGQKLKNIIGGLM